MKGCDTCDEWYHYQCVGIKEPPGKDESWFCRKCVQKQQQIESKFVKKKEVKKRVKDKWQLGHEEHNLTVGPAANTKATPSTSKATTPSTLLATNLSSIKSVSAPFPFFSIHYFNE